MRWDALFADLEAHAVALEQAERAIEVHEQTRAEVAALRLVDRLRPSICSHIRLRCCGQLQLAGELARVGAGWLLLSQPAGRESLVVTDQLITVAGLGRLSAAPGSEGVVASRLGLRHALRGLVRDRSPVRVHLVDGSTLDGTLDRVGNDFVELAAHAPGEWRRTGEVRDCFVVPLAALVAISRDG